MSPHQTRGTVFAKNGAIATSHTLASQTGLNILRLGGNFADAAIATSAVLCVAEPSASHLGGDGFVVLWDGTESIAINGSGKSLRAPTGEWEELGVTSFTVPGLAGVWDSLHSRYGTMDFPTLLADAIRYSEEGCPVGSRWHNAARLHRDRLRNDPGAAAQFLRDREPPALGSLVRQPDLGATLRAIAEDGPRAFYQGDLATRIISGLQEIGSRATMDDFRDHRTDVLPPLSTQYRDFEIHGQPPPSQGIILLEEIGLLDGFPAHEPLSPETIHLQIEAYKLAFADRLAHIADPNHHDNPTDRLLSKEYLGLRREEIWHDRSLPDRPSPGNLGPDTTYFCVADAAGRAVSFIQSVYYAWGSGVVVPGTGVLLNNRMNGFERNPESINGHVPGKRPVHTLNAYMGFKNGRPVFVGGTPGAQVQVQSNMQIIAALVDHGIDPQRLVELPRWRYSLPGDGEEAGVYLEDRIPKETVVELLRIGHVVHGIGPWEQGGIVQLIVLGEDGVMAAGSDPRGAGIALGW